MGCRCGWRWSEVTESRVDDILIRSVLSPPLTHSILWPISRVNAHTQGLHNILDTIEHRGRIGAGKEQPDDAATLIQHRGS
jgi:hypothetical protein